MKFLSILLIAFFIEGCCSKDVAKKAHVNSTEKTIQSDSTHTAKAKPNNPIKH
jgi:PBP1b-binding outer membrane lipoprotein LpoB